MRLCLFHRRTKTFTKRDSKFGSQILFNLMAIPQQQVIVLKWCFVRKTRNFINKFRLVLFSRNHLCKPNLLVLYKKYYPSFRKPFSIKIFRASSVTHSVQYSTNIQYKFYFHSHFSRSLLEIFSHRTENKTNMLRNLKFSLYRLKLYVTCKQFSDYLCLNDILLISKMVCGNGLMHICT